MAMHTVKAGEWMKQIALEYGFPNWEKIWDHPDNAELVKLRKEPGLLHPGDKIVIPDIEEHSISVPSDKKHKFVKTVPKTTIKIKIQDEQGEPVANTPWKIALGDKTFEGTSDGEGLVEQEIFSQTGQGELEIGAYKFPLRIGHMDPVEELEGAQKRLHNLGYDCGQVDGEEGEKMEQALKLFQLDNELEESGKLDQATKDKLKEIYGC